MTLEVVGAGLGRTGTNSLKLALERLLDGPCYHMVEVFGRPEHIPAWRAAVDGDLPDWDELFAGYRSAVDWPVAAFWRELADAYPDAPVLLSVRDVDGWWKSANDTIFTLAHRELPEEEPFASQVRMAIAMLDQRFTPGWRDEAPAKAAYLRHNEAVRAAVPGDRLVEWRPGDGWEPLCSMLGVAVPDEPFPHVNTTEDFRAMAGLDEPA
jgi:hypothetical protein